MNSHQARERILVFDDDQGVLGLLERVLSREGYQVTTMRSSERVVSLMSTEHFDLAIMDVGFRNLNGRELTRMVRQLSPETAVVLMTGYPVEEVIRFAQEHAQGCLEKPFDLQELLAMVRSALGEAPMSGRDVATGCHVI
jgi:DNA-binding response OmpR family regulator